MVLEKESTEERIQTMKKHNLLTSCVTIFGIVFICEAFTMQFVYDTMDFLKTPLSPYATGEFWYVVSSGLLLIGCCYFILACLFIKSEQENPAGIKAGSYLLIVTSICTFFLTIFYTDISPTSTVRGHIHVISAHLHFIFLPLAIIVISLNLRGTFWKKYKVYSFWFAILLIIVGLTLIFKRGLGIDQYSGMIQKIVIFAIIVWVILSAQVHRQLLIKRT